MKEIPLTNGGVAKVSDGKYEKAMTRKWCRGTTGYIVSVKYLGRINGKTVNESVLLHRFVADAKPGQMLDHKNGDKADCQDENLRFVTMSQNVLNSKVRVDNTSGAKGVGFNKALGKWRARYVLEGKEQHIGYFSTKEGAILALDEVMRRRLGDEAVLQ